MRPDHRWLAAATADETDARTATATAVGAVDSIVGMGQLRAVIASQTRGGPEATIAPNSQRPRVVPS
jgi:hypothetical protein